MTKLTSRAVRVGEDNAMTHKNVSLLVFASFLLFAASSQAKNNSNSYQVGTFVSASALADGTITDTLHGDGTTVAGGVYANQVGVYTIKVANGTWFVTTLTQTQDSMLRGMGMTPLHFKSEKANPLDGLKSGDKVMFRLHERHYLNGKVTLMAIPYADNPNKEVEFSTRFEADVVAPTPTKPTDNVKAMCDAHKLSAELEQQLCAPVSLPTEATAAVSSVLTNQSIVDMVKTGYSTPFIIARIQTSTTNFDMSAASTATLMTDAPRISMKVITVMVNAWMKQ
jgi:hypothetical protein